MAKWRDVKQNRVKFTEDNSKNILHSSIVSISKRFRAFLTDLFLITTPILYIVIYLILDGGDSFSQNRTLGWSIILISTFFILAIFWLKNGQTPGLKAYDLKLVDNKTKTRVSILQIFIRYLSTLFSIILVAPLFLFFSIKRKKLFKIFYLIQLL